MEKARYEVGRTRRQYDLVDPANRLVAGELEARWNQAMEHVAELERQCVQWDNQTPGLTGEERTGLLDMGHDLPALWHHPTASDTLKKRVLRTVVEEIVIRDDEARRNHLLVMHWKGGVHTELQVPRAPAGRKTRDCEAPVLNLIEELSKVCSDQAIAAILNRLGYQTGGGLTWRIHSVYSARYYHRLKNHRKDGRDFPAREHDRRASVNMAVGRFFNCEFFDSEDVLGEKGNGVERLVLGGVGEVAFQCQVAEVGGDGRGDRSLRSLFETLQTEAGEAGHPMDVGLFGGVGKTGQSHGTAQGIDNAGDFSVGFGQRSGRLRRKGRDYGANLDGLTAKRAVIGLPGTAPGRQALPVIGGCPREGENRMGRDAHTDWTRAEECAAGCRTQPAGRRRSPRNCQSKRWLERPRASKKALVAWAERLPRALVQSSAHWT